MAEVIDLVPFVDFDPNLRCLVILSNAEWAALISMAHLALECGNKATNLRTAYESAVTQLKEANNNKEIIYTHDESKIT